MFFIRLNQMDLFAVVLPTFGCSAPSQQSASSRTEGKARAERVLAKRSASVKRQAKRSAASAASATHRRTAAAKASPCSPACKNKKRAMADYNASKQQERRQRRREQAKPAPKGRPRRSKAAQAAREARALLSPPVELRASPPVFIAMPRVRRMGSLCAGMLSEHWAATGEVVHAFAVESNAVARKFIKANVKVQRLFNDVTSDEFPNNIPPCDI